MGHQGLGWTQMCSSSRRAKEEIAAKEARGEEPSSAPEVPPSESHPSDGFLWPEALAEIAFLPTYQPRLPLPGLQKPGWSCCAKGYSEKVLYGQSGFGCHLSVWGVREGL